MLYKKIVAVSLATFAFLSSSTFGADYYVSGSPQEHYNCPTDTICNIYCDYDFDSATGLIFHCQDASQCNFHCDEKKCGYGALIYGDNATTLNITQGSAGQECLKEAWIEAPHNGDAYFSTVSKAGFRYMEVYSASNTKNIIIDCDSPQSDPKGEDCSYMKVYATTAEFLHINIGNDLEFNDAIVNCPVDSTYNGPNIAPCIINIGTGGWMDNVFITAERGTPIDVDIIGCDDDKCKLFCDNKETIDWSPFINGPCWRTLNPTQNPTIKPTSHPTVSPTSNPSVSPTHEPTLYPTMQPTVEPTMIPSISPTIEPNTEPSKYPTITPTYFPTTLPTRNPTLKPTFTPIFSPTMTPTLLPTFHPAITTFNPTFKLTINPTYHPSILRSTDGDEYNIVSEDNNKLNNTQGFIKEFLSHPGNWAAVIFFCICLVLCFLLLKKHKKEALRGVIAQYAERARAYSPHILFARASHQQSLPSAPMHKQNNNKPFVVDFADKESSNESRSSEDMYRTPPKTRGQQFQSHPDDVMSFVSVTTAPTSVAKCGQLQKYTLELVDIQSNIAYSPEPKHREQQSGSMVELLKRSSHNQWSVPRVDFGVNNVNIVENVSENDEDYSCQEGDEEEHNDSDYEDDLDILRDLDSNGHTTPR